MRFKRTALLIILLFAFVIDWTTVIHSKVLFENIITMAVDRFERDGEWVAKFSKFRSHNWENDLTKEYQKSNEWLKWLKVDEKDADKKHLRSEVLLPDAIQKNTSLKDKEKTILAVKGKWDFPGFNWLVLEPSNVRPSYDSLIDRLKLVAKVPKDRTKQPEGNDYYPRRLDWNKKVDPNFIWFSGMTKALSVYVWGGNFNYNMEVHLQDYKGNNYVLPVANLNYKGWKNHKILIPQNIRQLRHQVPTSQPLKFLRFKILADPYEDPSEFYMYLDYFHAIIDTYEPSFFGEELQFVEKYWGDNNPSK